MERHRRRCELACTEWNAAAAGVNLLHAEGDAAFAVSLLHAECNATASMSLLRTEWNATAAAVSLLAPNGMPPLLA